MWFKGWNTFTSKYISNCADIINGKTFLSPVNNLCGSIPGFPMLFHLFICLSMCQTTTLVTIAHEIRLMWILHYFLLQNCFGYPRSAFLYAFQIILSVSKKKKKYFGIVDWKWSKFIHQIGETKHFNSEAFCLETWCTSPLFIFIFSQ